MLENSLIKNGFWFEQKGEKIHFQVCSSVISSLRIEIRLILSARNHNIDCNTNE